MKMLRPHLPALLFLLAADLLVFHRMAFFGSWPYVGDVVEQFYPWEEFIRRCLALGEVPLWNPYNNCGTPFMANLQSSVFYPVEMLLLGLPSGTAIAWSTVLHYAIAGWGMYFLALRFNAERWGAALAGLAYMLNGFAMIHLWAGNTLTLYAAAWAPWAFLAAEGAFTAKDWRNYVLGASVIWALHFLCGHAQLTFYSAVFTSLYVAVRALAGRTRHDALAAGRFFGAAIFGILLAGIQFLPTAEFAAHSSRSGGLDYDHATEFSLPPNRILNFFLPDFFGSRAERILIADGRYGDTFWADWKTWSNNYVGVSAAVFAAWFAVAWVRKNGWAALRQPVPLALLVVASVAFFCAAGRYTPIYRFIFPLPGFNLFRAPSKFTPYLLIPILVAASHGVMLLMTSVQHRRIVSTHRVFGLLFIVAGMAVLPLPTLFRSHFAGLDKWTPVSLAALHSAGVSLLLYGAIQQYRRGPRRALALSLILMFLLIDLFVFADRYIPYNRPLSNVIQELRYTVQHTSPDEVRVRGAAQRDSFFEVLLGPDRSDSRVGGGVEALAPHEYIEAGVEYSGAYDPLMIGRYVEFMDHFQGRVRGFRDVLSGPLPEKALVMAGIAVHTVALREAQRDRGGFSTRFYHGPEIPSASRYPADPRHEVVLERAPDDLVLVRSDAPITPSFTRKGIQGTRLVQFEAPAPGWLYVTDAWYPGWVARDAAGRTYPIVPANHAFRAISLPAGFHTLTLAYEPLSFRAGCGVTGAASVIWLLLLWSGIRRQRAPRLEMASAGSSLGMRGNVMRKTVPSPGRESTSILP